MKTMTIQYFAPLFNTATSIFALHKSTIFLGIGLTAIMDWISRTNFLGVSMALILITVFNIIYNTWTGAMASHHEAKICKQNNDLECYEKKRFDAKKLMFVVFKFITFFTWLFIAKVVKESFDESDFFNVSFRILGLSPVILFLLYEFISANKNIKRKYGKYSYLVKPIMKIFDALEKKFDKMLG